MTEYFKSHYINDEEKRSRVLNCNEEFENLQVLAERLHFIIQELTESNLPLVTQEILRKAPSMASFFEETRILTDIAMDYSDEISQMLEFFTKMNEIDPKDEKTA